MIMRKIISGIMLAGIFVSVIMTSCDTVTPYENEEEPNVSIWPMNVGNSWTYESYLYKGYIEENGEIIYNQYPIGTSSLIIYAYKEIQGYKGYTFNETHEEESIVLLNLDDEGNVTQAEFYKNDFICNSILYKKNVKKGDTWFVCTNEYNTTGEIRYSCIASDTIISTPLGNFHCKGYRHDVRIALSSGYMYMGYEDYFSEGVGLVKQIIYYIQSLTPYLCFEQKEYILTDYHLK